MPPSNSSADWLDRALFHGESVQDSAPDLAAARDAVTAVLRRAFERHTLDVAGPALAFDPNAAFAAAELLAAACWRQASGEPGPALPGLPEPGSAGAHLSADVALRLLPDVWRRAAGSGLAAELEAVLRAWPLSGVRADLAGSPTTPPDFRGHRGLQLLYAERLALAPRAGWMPPEGAARELAGRVFAARRGPIPDPLPEPLADAPPDA